MATARPAGRAPEAMGRSRFTGWSRSRSRSATSLSRYMAPDSAQNTTKAATATHTAGENNCCAKTRPANTKRFFTHWRGRSETMMAFIPRGPCGGRRPRS